MECPPYLRLTAVEQQSSVLAAQPGAMPELFGQSVHLSVPAERRVPNQSTLLPRSPLERCRSPEPDP